jgi:hypothetical protein
MTTSEMKDLGMIDIPLTADEVRTAILALNEAEEIHLRRADRYKASASSQSYAYALESAAKAQRLAQWIAHHADKES